MRDSLYQLIKNTLVFEYNLPCKEKGISKTIFSTDDDHCYKANCNESLVKIIYNSIIDYSFSTFELDENTYENLLQIALRRKLKYDKDATQETKVKYGFYGEVLLYCILHVIFQAPPAISRGWFYNPLEYGETKGYDSYHLVESKNDLQLWFGEAKFHSDHSSGIKDVIKNIDKAISDKYLNKNVTIISDYKHNFEVAGEKLKQVICEWEQNPSVNLIEFLKKYNCELVYPILLLYKHDTRDYDKNIAKVIEHIKENYEKKEFNISINYKLFFILLPIENVKQVKEETIECIEQKKPLIL